MPHMYIINQEYHEIHIQYKNTTQYKKQIFSTNTKTKIHKRCKLIPKITNIFKTINTHKHVINN